MLRFKPMPASYIYIDATLRESRRTLTTATLIAAIARRRTVTYAGIFHF